MKNSSNKKSPFYVKCAEPGSNSFHVARRDKQQWDGYPWIVDPYLTFEQAAQRKAQLDKQWALYQSRLRKAKQYQAAALVRYYQGDRAEFLRWSDMETNLLFVAENAVPW